MPVVSMSKQEFNRLEVLSQVQSGRLRVVDACALTGLRRRQIFLPISFHVRLSWPCGGSFLFNRSSESASGQSGFFRFNNFARILIYDAKQVVTGAESHYNSPNSF